MTNHHYWYIVHRH